MRDRGARLLRALLKPFSSCRPEPSREQPSEPGAAAASSSPPPLPPAQVKYVLYRCGEGAFDVFDGDQMVGDLFRYDGNGERGTFWVVTLYNAHFDGFGTLKAAKEWLGHPPARKYRQSKTHHLDVGRSRERRIATQRQK
jgi:hypothetical protein